MHTLATSSVNHSRMQVRFHTDSVLPANFAVWDDIHMFICEYVCHASQRILSMQHIICKESVTTLRKLTSVVNTRRLSLFPGDTYGADGCRIVRVDLRGDGRGWTVCNDGIWRFAVTHTVPCQCYQIQPMLITCLIEAKANSSLYSGASFQGTPVRMQIGVTWRKLRLGFDWRLNLAFGTHKKICGNFSRTKFLCHLDGGVPWVSHMRGSTVL